ncbi:PIG-X-domain-containing protein [Lentithecium fluviatile CBS 122367]|uniref:Protein PBN1 n=1 Tax=Lentithecium fluviatile CBS 122367 TaxID=1168545 RepID=A0A6G1IEZ4_9PLEO|nr:PIG-X-domain-containing protein [Lentithecium fluviatile CBS 122367]
MKQRITYIVRNPDEFTPEQLEVIGRSLNIQKLNAAKEHRITLGLKELPRELSKAFEQWHELHIRWASEKTYPSIPPFTSRVTSGLHVFFTPHKDQPEGQLCDLLHYAFGPDLKCSSTNEASTKLPILSERFSMSASSQYYSYLPTLNSLVSYIQEEVCKSSVKACKNAASSLLSASYLDIDYDTISHAVVLNAFWSGSPEANHWTETITLPSKDQTTEVGVLNYEKNPDPEDIGFGGFLTVLGQDDAPKPTQFQTPTRHYPLTHPLTYTTTFQPPTGLHPTLHLSFPASSPLTPPDPTCKLHTHLTLPSPLFIDKYQFSDPLFLTSHNLVSLHSISGATDLEAPDWVVPQWGSAALFELAVPPSSGNGNGNGKGGGQADWNVTITLHLRYLPATGGGYTRVPIAWPVVFWACRAEEGTKMSVNPFDRLHLGYEGLFGPRTRFMHGSPAEGAGRLVEWVTVPVLDLRKTKWVEVGTIGTVVVAFLGLCWMLFGRKTEVKNGGMTKKKQ